MKTTTTASSPRRSSSTRSSSTLSPPPSQIRNHNHHTTTTPTTASADGNANGAYALWKREPNTADVFFGLELPYRPPRSWVGAFFWRRRMWLETTFALSMMERWEKGVIMWMMYALLTLVLTAAYLYLPLQIRFVRQRAAYYLLGDVASASSTVSASAAAVVGSVEGVGRWVGGLGSAGAEL